MPGCTERKYLAEYAYCFSCDSTSWQSAFRFGGMSTDRGRLSIRTIRHPANFAITGQTPSTGPGHQ
ncbi:MAG: hypothetical protein QNK37_32160 [Acidobacteriota bacterium]|nr:hypothetical protein [Acidobacteriota bacterium]